MAKNIQLNADSNFFIGDQHLRQGKPCQDYTLTERVGKAILAIVCDGCSTGLKTDVGARMWALATFAAIRGMFQENPTTTIDANITRKIDDMRRVIVNESKKIFGLHFNDLLATCGYALFSKHSGIIHLVGDGVVVEKYRDGRTVLHRYDWNHNTPAYPMYADDFYVAFISAHGGNINETALKRETVTIVGSEVKDRVVTEIPLGAGMIGTTMEYDQKAIEELEFVCIASDGITQIRKVADSQFMNWQLAAMDLVDFKSTPGEFVKRRTRSLVQGLGKSGHVLLDDLGCATVALMVEDDEKE
jgi:hypothetical protein